MSALDPNKYKRKYRYRSDVNDRDAKTNNIMIAIGVIIVIALYFLLT